MLQWFVVLHGDDGSRREIPAGFGAFQPRISGFATGETTALDVEFELRSDSALDPKTMPKFKLDVQLLPSDTDGDGMFLTIKWTG
jgi:hypothetical protein